MTQVAIIFCVVGEFELKASSHEGSLEDHCQRSVDSTGDFVVVDSSTRSAILCKELDISMWWFSRSPATSIMTAPRSSSDTQSRPTPRTQFTHKVPTDHLSRKSSRIDSACSACTASYPKACGTNHAAAEIQQPC